MRSQVPLAALLLLLAVLAPATATTSSCSFANPAYIPQQSLHVFVPGTPPAAFDTSGCATGDGDNETGLWSAQFPEMSQGACDPPPPFDGHHNGGVGATATVQSNTLNLPVDYTFGTDGQQGGVDVATSPCTSNAIVSDSYDTDPFDCGSGLTGHFPGGPAADLQPNVNPHANTASDPDPWAIFYGAIAQGAYRQDPNGVECFGVRDGSAWAILLSGAGSTPIAGTITAP